MIPWAAAIHLTISKYANRPIEYIQRGDCILVVAAMHPINVTFHLRPCSNAVLIGVGNWLLADMAFSATLMPNVLEESPRLVAPFIFSAIARGAIRASILIMTRRPLIRGSALARKSLHAVRAITATIAITSVRAMGRNSTAPFTNVVAPLGAVVITVNTVGALIYRVRLVLVRGLALYHGELIFERVGRATAGILACGICSADDRGQHEDDTKNALRLHRDVLVRS